MHTAGEVIPLRLLLTTVVKTNLGVGLVRSSSELVVLRTRESASTSPTLPKVDRGSPKREPQSPLVHASSR